MIVIQASDLQNILRLCYDNGKVVIDLKIILRRTQGSIHSRNRKIAGDSVRELP